MVINAPAELVYEGAWLATVVTAQCGILGLIALKLLSAEPFRFGPHFDTLRQVRSKLRTKRITHALRLPDTEATLVS